MKKRLKRLEKMVKRMSLQLARTLEYGEEQHYDPGTHAIVVLNPTGKLHEKDVVSGVIIGFQSMEEALQGVREEREEQNSSGDNSIMHVVETLLHRPATDPTT